MRLNVCVGGWHTCANVMENKEYIFKKLFTLLYVNDIEKNFLINAVFKTLGVSQTVCGYDA